MTRTEPAAEPSAAPLDLDAIRADQAALATYHTARRSLLPVERRLTDVHLPALLALVAEQAATIAATDAERDRLEAEARRLATARRLEEAAHRQTLAERDDAEHRVALAQRLARRDDYDLDVDLPGVIGDGLCGAADWDGDDRPPRWLVDRVVEVVGPYLARATERAERRGLAWESARRRAARGFAECDAIDRARTERTSDGTVIDAYVHTALLVTVHRIRAAMKGRNATGAPESPGDAPDSSNDPTPT